MADPSLNHTAPPRRWWIRLCRWLWGQRSLIWISIILGVAISVFGAWLFTPWGTDFTKHPIGWAIKNPLVLLLIGICLLLLTALVGVVCYLEESQARHSALISPTQQSRRALLRFLRQEYARQLMHSLQGAAILTLGLHERTDITRSSAQLVFRRTEVKEVHEHPLLPGTSIVQAYEDAGHGLLILGEPGAGKTILLLDLARELLIRAESDPTHPIPVILNLSS